MSIICSILEYNSWEKIHKIVKSGKMSETSWTVGDTKTLTINNATKTATLIGINHDGENTATFMVMDSIGDYTMNSTNTNAGGWKDSNMRNWLNSDIYNSMIDVKDYIKEVDKYTNNIGYQGNTVTVTSDKVFLSSPKEAGFICPLWYSDYNDVFDNEGTSYEWFINNAISDYFWLRSPDFNYSNFFFSYNNGRLGNDNVNSYYSVFPTFVIG